MQRKLTCIQCPQGCQLTAEIENGYVVKISGNRCPKGAEYAKQEIENPTRVLSSTVLAEGLSLKMVPVKTSKPIPKSKLLDAMTEIKKIKINKPVHTNDVIVANFLGLGVDLVAGRDVKKMSNFQCPMSN